jgi:hypothetical protein
VKQAKRADQLNLLVVSATANPLLIENAIDDSEFTAAHFLEAVFGVEMLGADEDDGGVEA